MTTDWPLTVDPHWSRKLARIMRDPRIRELGTDWWHEFVEEAGKVSRIDDLPPQYREVIKPLVEE